MVGSALVKAVASLTLAGVVYIQCGIFICLSVVVGRSRMLKGKKHKLGDIKCKIGCAQKYPYKLVPIQ